MSHPGVILSVNSDETVTEEDIDCHDTVWVLCPTWQDGCQHTEPVCHKVVNTELGQLIDSLAFEVSLLFIEHGHFSNSSDEALLEVTALDTIFHFAALVTPAADTFLFHHTGGQTCVALTAVLVNDRLTNLDIRTQRLKAFIK